MKSAVYYGTERISLEERDFPEPDEGEAVLKVRSVGVCPTDVKAYFFGSSSIRAPLVLGHEVSGTIVSSCSERLSEGENVNVAADAPCLKCPICLKGMHNMCPNMISLGVHVDGGYSQYMRIPRDFVNKGLVYRLDRGTSFAAGSLMEPVAVSLHCLNLVKCRTDDDAVVIGDGPNGLIHLQILKRVIGIRSVTVIGLSAERLAFASTLGADRTVNMSVDKASFERLQGEGADIIDVTIGNNEAMAEAAAIARKGSRLLIFGGSVKDSQIPFTMNDVHYRQLVITGSSGTDIPDYEAAVNLVNSRVVDTESLVTERFSLSEIVSALNYSKELKGLKCIVEPNPE